MPPDPSHPCHVGQSLLGQPGPYLPLHGDEVRAQTRGHALREGGVGDSAIRGRAPSKSSQPALGDALRCERRVVDRAGQEATPEPLMRMPPSGIS